MAARRGIATVAAFLALMAAPLAQDARRFAGTSSASGAGCQAMTFDIVVQGGRISGHAFFQGSGGKPAEVDGTADASGAVVLETRLDGGSGRLQRTRWQGTLSGSTLTMEQPSSVTCAPPRKAVLTAR